MKISNFDEKDVSLSHIFYSKLILELIFCWILENNILIIFIFNERIYSNTSNTFSVCVIFKCMERNDQMTIDITQTNRWCCIVFIVSITRAKNIYRICIVYRNDYLLVDLFVTRIPTNVFVKAIDRAHNRYISRQCSHRFKRNISHRRKSFIERTTSINNSVRKLEKKYLY